MGSTSPGSGGWTGSLIANVTGLKNHACRSAEAEERSARKGRHGKLTEAWVERSSGSPRPQAGPLGPWATKMACRLQRKEGTFDCRTGKGAACCQAPLSLFWTRPPLGVSVFIFALLSFNKTPLLV